MSIQNKSKPESQSNVGSFEKSVLSEIKHIGVSELNKPESSTSIHVNAINPRASRASNAFIKKITTLPKNPRRVNYTLRESSSNIGNLGSVLTKLGLEESSRKTSEQLLPIGSSLPLEKNTEKTINLFGLNTELLSLFDYLIKLLYVIYDTQKCDQLQIPLYYANYDGYCKCRNIEKCANCITIFDVTRGTSISTYVPIFGKFKMSDYGFIKYKEFMLSTSKYIPLIFTCINTFRIIFDYNIDINVSDNLTADTFNKIIQMHNSIKTSIETYNTEPHLNKFSQNSFDLFRHLYNLFSKIHVHNLINEINYKNVFNVNFCSATTDALFVFMQYIVQLPIITKSIIKQLPKMEVEVLQLNTFLTIYDNGLKQMQIYSYGKNYNFYKIKDICSSIFTDCNIEQFKEIKSAPDANKQVKRKKINIGQIENIHAKKKNINNSEPCINGQIKSFELPDNPNLYKKINEYLNNLAIYSYFIHEFNMLFLPKIKTEDDLNNKDNITNFTDIVDAITFIRTYTADFMTEYGQYSTSDAIKKEKDAKAQYSKKPMTNKVKLRLRSFLNKLTRKKKYDSTTNSTNKSAVNTKLSDFKKSENKYNPILYTEILPKVYDLCGRYISEININIPKIERIIRNTNSLPYQIQTQLVLTEELKKLNAIYIKLYNNLPAHKLEENKNTINKSKQTPDIRENIRENIKTFIALVDLGYMLFSLAEKFKGEARRKMAVKLTTSGNTTI